MVSQRDHVLSILRPLSNFLFLFIFFFPSINELHPRTKIISTQTVVDSFCSLRTGFVSIRFPPNSIFFARETNVGKKRNERREGRNEEEGKEKRTADRMFAEDFRAVELLPFTATPITSYWISKDWNCYLTFLKTHITIFSRISDAPSCYSCSVAAQQITRYIMSLSTNCKRSQAIY